MICWDISSVEGVSQCYCYCGFLLLWGGGRLWERLRIYSDKNLFNKSKFYLKKLLSLSMPVIKSGQTRMTSFLYVYNYIFFNVHMYTRFF